MKSKGIIVILLFFILLVSCINPPSKPTPQETIQPTIDIPTSAIPTKLLPSSSPTLTATVVPPTPTASPTPIPTAQGLGSRVEIFLDSQWDISKADSLATKPVSARWSTIDVPGYLSSYDYRMAWFRKKFNVPKEWQDKRLILRFGGVKYNSRVLVNGQDVGGNFNGYDEFEIDITNAVQFGKMNELLVGAHDWTGVFSGEPIDLPPNLAGDALRNFPEDRVLSPVGGHFDYYGIWDSVTLRVVPSVYIQSIFVRPSVRRNVLEIDVTLQNPGSTPFNGFLKGRIFNWLGGNRDEVGQWPLQGNPIVVFSDLAVNCPPGKSSTLTMLLENPGLSLWWPYQPDLYVLEIGLNAPQPDAVRERIGFREFWIENGDFYLNGKKIHLLATSSWPPIEAKSRDFIVQRLKGIKAMNTMTYRTHTQPWPQIWYEVADEVGLLMIPEGAVWNDDLSYRVNDQNFWNNYAAHLQAMVKKLRNHPSIVIWSLENEFYGTRLNDKTPAGEQKLADMGRLVKQEDPTRPITYESDGDPGGIADIIGLHYPNEYPDYRLWPGDAYWMDVPRVLTEMFWDQQPFLWDQSKPLYIGEFMWEPARDPSKQTLFYGDDAYQGYSTYRTLAKAFAWRMQILAYRHYNVSGQSPWNVIEHGALDETNPLWVAQRDLYRPLAAYLREFDSHFYSGENITRTVEIFNDTLADLPQTNFKWVLLKDGQELSKGSETLSLESGDYHEHTINLSMPQVVDRIRLELRLELSADGQTPFQEKWSLDVFPILSQWDLPGTELTLFDPRNQLKPLWTKQGIPYRDLENIQDWDGQSILVIGPQALEGTVGESIDIPVIGTSPEGKRALMEKVVGGGKVLVLEQSHTASAWLPVRLSEQSSTIAFLKTPSHPIMDGLDTEDFRWWRGDNLVSRFEPERMAIAGTTPLVVTGSAQGVAHAPLLEIKQGKGLWIICQLQVVSKLESEPLAQLLLKRMVSYLASYQPVQGDGLFYGLPSISKKISELGTNLQELKGWNTLQYPQTQFLVLQTDNQSIVQQVDPIRHFLEAGGTILWDRPEPKELESIAKALGLPITIQPYKGFSLKAGGQGNISEALFYEDLYWLGNAESFEWNETPLALDTADYIINWNLNVTDNISYKAIEDVELEGNIIRVRNNRIEFATNGSARWTIDIPESGTYQLGISASGSPAGGVYPQAEILLDSQRIGLLYAGNQNKTIYNVQFRTEAGKHRLTVTFTNDDYAPPEDRNLYVDSFTLGRVEGESQIIGLTTPTTLVDVPIGQGHLLLNTVRWDEAGQNDRKAKKFFASLLTAIGAHFQWQTEVTVIEAESLKPQPNFKYFQKEADHILMATEGYVEGQIKIARAGQYQMGILAKGSPVKGTYPILAIELNGKSIGKIEITSDNWNLHTFTVELPEGTYKLGIRFTNDEWDPGKGEDRNVWIDWLSFTLMQ